MLSSKLLFGLKMIIYDERFLTLSARKSLVSRFLARFQGGNYKKILKFVRKLTFAKN